MSDFPIIFSGQMIRALPEQKRMTRRLARRINSRGEEAHSPWTKVQPGDRLWVRESVVMSRFSGAVIAYMADDRYAARPGEIGRPSIHMPRWASRFTLVVTLNRTERLQEITDADARLEGVVDRSEFEALWERLHGRFAWDRNPLVVVLGFEVHRCNIDHMPREKAA